MAAPPFTDASVRRQLRVLMFSPNPSLGGGVVEFAEVLKRRLSPSIRMEWFLTGRRPGPLGKAFRTIIPILDSFRLLARLVTDRHDIYHLNTSVVPRSVWRDGIFLLILRLFRKHNVLVFFRGWDTEYFNHIASSRYGRFLFMQTFGHAARVLVLSSVFANDLRMLGFPPASIHVITTMFDGDTLRHAVRSRKDTDVRILFLARFVSAKGVYQLLEAFRRASLDDSRLTLTLAGDGDEGMNLQEWCNQRGLLDRVSFPGYVRGAQKAQFLVDSDIFVLPSHHSEGCPNALLEAMAAGLPIIVTPVGGIPDIVRDGVHGLVIPPRDTDALESALRKLVADPGLRAAMARMNRAEAWNKFEAGSVTTRLEAHYWSLDSRTGTQPKISHN